MEISRRRAVSKAQVFEREYDTKVEFLGDGGGGQFKKPSVGGLWIFSGTIHCHHLLLLVLLH